MSDKQLTGTITLPGVDPELYEPVFEIRCAEPGEMTYVVSYGFDAIAKEGTRFPAIILKRKTAIRASEERKR